MATSKKTAVYTRQQGIIDSKRLAKADVTIIGSGSIGSFTALTLAKMGVGTISIYDNDGVADHNLPNQFFKKTDLKRYKVVALGQMLGELSDVHLNAIPNLYVKQPLTEIVIVATDSMASRKVVWEQFKKQKTAKILIEARMGAELGRVYTITKNNKGKLSKEDIEFYEKRLYTSKEAVELPCTAKTIIYNVLMISSLICRSFKGMIMQEKIPRELIFNMTALDERSYMFSV